MLASIQSYLNRTQELMQNPTVMLPSLPDPPAPGQPTVPDSVTIKRGEETLSYFRRLKEKHQVHKGFPVFCAWLHCT